jgi:hypothetical protein
MGMPKMNVNPTYPNRVKAFRKQLIDSLPRIPDNRESLAALHAMPTGRLILAYITWKMRLIPQKPRVVKFWGGGISPLQVAQAKKLLRPFLAKVRAGEDLTPHLSTLVNKTGIVLNGANPSYKKADIDVALTRHGLHHFHVAAPSTKNPKGRSGSLVFAEVLEKEFRVVAISNHGAFKSGTEEQIRFLEICNAYITKDIPAGQGFLANPVMSSGHLLTATLFSDACANTMEQLDPMLDDPLYIEKLYRENDIYRDSVIIEKPKKPSLAWSFQDLQFGILDKSSNIFFCIYPFFKRQ